MPRGVAWRPYHFELPISYLYNVAVAQMIIRLGYRTVQLGIDQRRPHHGPWVLLDREAVACEKSPRLRAIRVRTPQYKHLVCAFRFELMQVRRCAASASQRTG